jgi:hypothetical protein
MGKREDAKIDGGRGAAESTAQGHGRRSLELGRSEVNVEFLKRFGSLSVPGVGTISLLYRNPVRGKVSVHFDPSDEIIAYLAEENGYGDGEELSTREPYTD